MSNENSFSNERHETRRRITPGRARKSAEPKQEVELIALEIDEDFDLGSDPYNHTGSHCIVKLRDH